MTDNKNELEILNIKLHEYKAQLQEEINRIANPYKEEREKLEAELKVIKARQAEIKQRLREIMDASKDNKAKVLELARKIRAIDQLL